MAKARIIMHVVFLYLLVSLSLCLWSENISAQNCSKRANHWYFGANAGLDFSSGTPVPVLNGVMNQGEGCASISDKNGNLLMYTDGDSLWNRIHKTMPNGFELTKPSANGSVSTSQPAVIVPQPGNDSLYYIFTTDFEAGTAPLSTISSGFRYSIVNINLDGGLGDIAPADKNIVLLPHVTERVTAVHHCNGEDIWIITHKFNMSPPGYLSDSLYAYLLTKNGISPPVISKYGYPTAWCNGQLKASPNGKKLALTTHGSGSFVMDFDNATGAICNVIRLSTWPNCYGISFSPDNTKLYVGYWGSEKKLFQYNLNAGGGAPAAIIASQTLINNTLRISSLQLAPDGKIYIASNRGILAFPPPAWNTLSVINNPNAVGLASSFQDSAFFFLGTGRSAATGLPNFVESFLLDTAYLPLTKANFSVVSSLCSGTVNFTNTSLFYKSCSAAPTYSWNFGDPGSGVNNTSSSSNPTHIYTSAGNYTVVLVQISSCGNDTLQQNLTISLPVNSVVASSNISCNGSATGSATATVTTGTSPYTYMWSNGSSGAIVTGLFASTYTVTTTDASGCSSTQTVAIAEPAPLMIQTISTPDPCDSTTGSATAIPTGGTPAYTYTWNNGQNSPTATGLRVGNYTITIVDFNGCRKEATVTVSEIYCPCPNKEQIVVPNAFSPNGDGGNDEFCLQGVNPSLVDCIKDLSITIYNRWGEQVYGSVEKNFCWDGIYQGEPQNTGVFVYHLHVTLINEEKTTKKGNVSLIR